MKTRMVLFLDDWPILTRRGIDRRWFAAALNWPAAVLGTLCGASYVAAFLGLVLAALALVAISL